MSLVLFFVSLLNFPFASLTTVATPTATKETEGMIKSNEEVFENLQNDPPFSHQRRAEMGIPVGQAREPPLCPPPPVTQSLAICDLEKCSSYLDCPRNMACCFNGCIHSCIEPMDGPAAFDWVEDTSKVLPILGVDFEESAKPFIPILHNSTTKYAAAEAGEELIHLTGGCLVTVTRYTKLKEFMKAPSIKDCRCDDGEVVCDITTSRS